MCVLILYALIWVCGVNNHSVLRLVIYNKVGIVVTTPRPYGYYQHLFSSKEDSAWEERVNLHMGIDWICIARANEVNASCRNVSFFRWYPSRYI